MSVYRAGLDRLLDEEFHLIAGKTVGIVTNHTGVTQDMRSNFDVLASRTDVKVGALFAPEHGARGDVQAGGRVDNEVDPETGLPIYSLYGEVRTPTKEMLSGIDVMIYDLQDGRTLLYLFKHYAHVMQAAPSTAYLCSFLDRLNPIGRRVEGNILEPGFESFVGPILWRCATG